MIFQFGWLNRVRAKSYRKRVPARPVRLSGPAEDSRAAGAVGLRGTRPGRGQKLQASWAGAQGAWRGTPGKTGWGWRSFPSGGVRGRQGR